MTYLPINETERLLDCLGQVLNECEMSDYRPSPMSIDDLRDARDSFQGVWPPGDEPGIAPCGVCLGDECRAHNLPPSDLARHDAAQADVALDHECLLMQGSEMVEAVARLKKKPAGWLSASRRVEACISYCSGVPTEDLEAAIHDGIHANVLPPDTLEEECEHDLMASSMTLDPEAGWIVDVTCGECGQPGSIPVDPSDVNW